jgi:predicted TIM-barrel fold metal-dependent hydrolase
MDNADPPHAPNTPVTHLPPGSWDAHVHLLGGPEHPLSPTRVENPAPGFNFDDWLALYRGHLESLGCTRGLIVHSILYGNDNTVTLDAVREMGDGFKGVGLLPDDSQTAKIKRLADSDICAVRLNYVHGGILTWDGACKMAPRLADHGMHIQMLLHADQHIEQIADDVRILPTPLVIDHCGWPTDLTPDTPAIDTLCALLAEGHIWIKLSAPYRFTTAPLEANPIMRRLIDANPDQCLWGSDWPHIMLNGVPTPHPADLLDDLAAITTAEERQKIFKSNPDWLFCT